MEERRMSVSEVLSLAKETLEMQEDKTYVVNNEGLEVVVRCNETDLKYLTIDAISIALREEKEGGLIEVPPVPSSAKLEEMRLWFDIRANENVGIDMEALYKMVIKTIV